MATPFVPKKPELLIVANITKREAVLLMKLRKFPYGEAVVYKAQNVIVRVELKDSQLIDEDVAVELD